MKHLIIYAHPNEASINHRLKEKVLTTLKSNHHDVVVRDLYHLQFNPVLSLEDLKGQRAGQVDMVVKQEQEYITWADSITFVYPIWWTGMPAIMKGYIDRVMTYGFAYSYATGVQEGLLKGKQAIIINTQGKSHQEYQALAMDKALQLTSDTGVYTYCGFEVKEHFFFEKADKATTAVVEQWMKAVEEIYAL
jgi:NAD(P)H dehydrogenase (quinone)